MGVYYESKCYNAQITTYIDGFNFKELGQDEDHYADIGKYFKITNGSVQIKWSSSGGSIFDPMHFSNYIYVSIIKIYINNSLAFSINANKTIRIDEYTYFSISNVTSSLKINDVSTVKMKAVIEVKQDVSSSSTYNTTVNDELNLDIVAPKLQSIALTGTYQTYFQRRSAFNHNGLKLSKTYKYQVSEETFTDTNQEPDGFSEPNMELAGVQTVTVTGKSKYDDTDLITEGYEITVRPVRSIKINLPNTFIKGRDSTNPYCLPSGNTNVSTIFGGFPTFCLIEEGVEKPAIVLSPTTTPSVINISEAPSDGSVADIFYTAKLTYENIEISGSEHIFITYLRPVEIVTEGSDTSIYYIDRPNTFKLPVGITFKLKYNDGNTDVSAITPSTYHQTENDLTALNVGDDIGTNISGLYAYYSVTDLKSNNYILKKMYVLNYIQDTITSVVIENTLNFVLGNTLESQKSLFNIKVTYQNSGSVENFSNYSFVNTGYILSSLSTIDIKINGTTYTLDTTGKVTFVNPTFSSLEVINYPSTSYSNNLDKINISNTKIKVKYSNCSWTKEFSMGSSVVGDSDHYSISSHKKSDDSALFNPDDIKNYNGTYDFAVASLTSGIEECYFKFIVTEPFGSTPKEQKVYFDILSAVDVTGIKINSTYNDYKVGDLFLNDNDTTQVTIYWKNSSNVTQFKVIDLNKNYPSLVITPNKGYEFINSEKSRTVTIKSVTNSTVYAEYTIKVSPRNYTETTSTTELAVIWYKDIQLPDGTLYSPEHGVLRIYEESKTSKINGVRTFNGTPTLDDCYGYIDDIFYESKASKVVLFNDYTAPIDGSANIDVKFPSYTKGEADLINNCKFGCLFGANNSVNRLFVSGNTSIGNADWHTAEPNFTDYDGDVETVNGNFSYIPSESVMYYGETDNYIIGYDIVSNDKLLVLKTKSDKEKTVYFRVPQLLKALDASGNVMTDLSGNTLYQEEFSLVKGNNSVAGISPKSIVNFNGDTLFIDSDNHISGLDIEGIIGDNQRYANTRSKYIDNELKTLDLSDSVLWSNNKYLFFPVKDDGVYITSFNKKEDGQYEWWKITSHNPRVFIELNDEIYFGNSDGNFCKLSNGTYKDVTKLFAGKEQMLLITSFDDENDKIIIDQKIINQMSTEKSYAFKELIDEDNYLNNLYYKVAIAKKTVDDNTDVFIDQTKNTLKIYGLVGGVENLDRKKLLYVLLTEEGDFYLNYIKGEATEAKIDCTAGSSLGVFGAKYKLEKVLATDTEYDNEHDSFKLIKADGTRAQLSELNSASICQTIEKEVDISDIDKTNYTFKLKREGKYLDLVEYGLQNRSSINVPAEIKNYQNVEAYYITAPMLADNINLFKTVWQITLTNDTDIPSALKVCVASNKIPYYKTKDLAYISKDKLGVDYNKLSFEKVDYDKTVVPRTYSFDRVLGMQKFICFGFKNESGCNAVLSEMAITYTVPFKSYSRD